MIFIIDDEVEFAQCIAKMIPKKHEVQIFRNAIEAINATSEQVPDLIILDILLDGPDGFTFLNEMSSYEDTEKVPVVIMSSLDLKVQDLSSYGVVAQLNKAEMTPDDIQRLVEEYA